jgi:hypothetical protein
MPVIPLTDDDINNGLQSGFKLGSLQFTYSIPGAGSTWETDAFNYTNAAQNPSPPYVDRQPYDAAYSTLSVAQALNFISALAAWDSLIAPNFSSVADDGSGHGEVRVAFTGDQMTGKAGYAFQGSNQTPTSIVGDVWLNSNSTAATFDPTTNGYSTLLHEIGHVLGLKHSFDPPTTIAAPYDDTRYTVMSYTVPYAVVIANTGGGYSVNWTPVNSVTPSVLDIAAVQDLYGADLTTRTGNNTYTIGQTGLFFQSIYDAGGTDTIDLSSVTRGSIVDLNPGATSSIGHWTVAEQITYYAALTGDTEANISSYYTVGPKPNDYYEWSDNLGIARNTTIENLIAGSGNDTITGNSADNLIKLDLGGNDTVDAGGGSDGLYFGAALTALDSVNGGTGTLDQVGLQGTYAGFTFGANNLVNIDQLVLLSGTDTRFGDSGGHSYDYSLTTVDANVAAGDRLVVTFNMLQVGEDVTLNGAAETNGAFLTYAGLGADHLTGGAGDDWFYFGNNNRWGASDSVDGGAGTLDQLGLQGTYALTFGAGQLTGIEMLVLLTGGDTRYGNAPNTGYSYNITMNDANVAGGQTLYVSANTLRAGVSGVTDETLLFNGAAETNGNFVIYSGAAQDVLTGGSGNDTFYGGGLSDTLTGGAGNDTFAYTSTSNSILGYSDVINDFTLGDLIGLSAIDANSTTVGDDAFNFIGTAAFTGSGAASAGELRFQNIIATTWQVQGDTNGDGTADLVISVNVTDADPITAADFVL